MKFVKVIILASALAVSAFSLSGCSKTAQSQPEVTPNMAQTSATINELSANIGKYCFVYRNSGDSAPQGKLKSVTSSWIVLEEEGITVFKGGTIQHYIPTKDVSMVEFAEPLNKK